MSTVLPSASSSSALQYPTVDRKSMSKKTLVLAINDVSLTVVMTKFVDQRCSLRVVAGLLTLRDFETRIYKRNGPGPKTAFNQCR